MAAEPPPDTPFPPSVSVVFTCEPAAAGGVPWLGSAHRPTKRPAPATDAATIDLFIETSHGWGSAAALLVQGIPQRIDRNPGGTPCVEASASCHTRSGNHAE